MKKLLALLLLILPGLALAQPAPPIGPWTQNGPMVYYDEGCVNVPSTTPGGCMGLGTINTTGLFINGNAVNIGGVTSVGLALPNIFNVTGSPVTNIGTLTGTLANQAANLVFAGPGSGAATTPAFRALVAADIPTLSTTVNGQTCTIGSACTVTAAATSIAVGTTTISSGNANGLLFNSAGVLGNLASSNSGVLVTNGSGVPSISTTLPDGLALGTPASGVATNLTGTAAGLTAGTASAVAVGGITGLGTGVATWLATPSSANLITAVTDETGSGSLVFANTPTLVTPVLGAATGTSVALGGCTIGSNAFCATGTANISGNTTLGSTAQLLWSTDLIVTRRGAANINLGATDVDTAPVAQTISVQGALTGGTTNVAGADLTLKLSQGKGTGVGGGLKIQIAPAGSSGSTPNTFVDFAIYAANRTVTWNSATAGHVWDLNTFNCGAGAAGRSLTLTIIGQGVACTSTLGFHVNDNKVIGILSGGLNTGPDIALSRVSANTFAVGTGAFGSVAGSLQALQYTAAPGTAISSGGSNTFGFKATSTVNFGLFFGSGAPSLSTAQGSLYLRSDGVPYYNTNGTTGWAQLASTESPTLVTPVLGVATGTSLALNGCTIGSNVLCTTGTILVDNTITSTIGTITTSRPILDATQTWNAAGVAFKAINVNVTNTASAAGARFIDLQVGGASKFSVTKDGSIYVGHSSENLISSFGTNGIMGFLPNGINESLRVLFPVIGRGGIHAAYGYSAASTGSLSGNFADAYWNAIAAGNWRSGAPDVDTAPVAQTFSVQGALTGGTSNVAGANWTFKGSQSKGSGNGGSIIFQTTPAGGSGSTPNAFSTVLTLDSTLLATFGGAKTSVGASTILNATAIPAGGTAGSGYKFSSTTNFGVFFGSGAPTLSAAKGSLYLRSDGSGTTDRAYINTDGGTTWTALTTAGFFFPFFGMRRRRPVNDNEEQGAVKIAA